MAGKNSKSKKQIKAAEEVAARRQKVSQIIFAAFAILLILSMVLSAVAKF
jgi:predicted nucleic acid-binding Zn ribbon protein